MKFEYNLRFFISNELRDSVVGSSPQYTELMVDRQKTFWHLHLIEKMVREFKIQNFAIISYPTM